MKTIIKIMLTSEPGKYPVKMPKGATILNAAVVGGLPCVFAKANDAEPDEERVLEVYETGGEVNEYDLQYVGTLVLQVGRVIHIFENK